MNETIQSILNRRSIRKYKPDPIPPEDLKQILIAGLHAPSAMGRQPWHLVVVMRPERIAEVNREVKAATIRMPDNPYKDYVGSTNYTVNYQAPVFVIVSANTTLSPRNAPFDCALVLGNMFLAAYSLGIGSCWINQLNVLNEESGFRAYMTKIGIPAKNWIFGAACFGYADGTIPPAAARKGGNVVFLE